MSLMILGIAPGVQAQEDSPDMIWESIIITPDYTKLKELGESMARHNKKYHASGKYQAYVYNISSGPNMGQMVWEMGPLTLSDLDGRPAQPLGRAEAGKAAPDDDHTMGRGARTGRPPSPSR